MCNLFINMGGIDFMLDVVRLIKEIVQIKGNLALYIECRRHEIAVTSVRIRVHNSLFTFQL